MIPGEVDYILFFIPKPRSLYAFFYVSVVKFMASFCFLLFFFFFFLKVDYFFRWLYYYIFYTFIIIIFIDRKFFSTLIIIIFSIGFDMLFFLHFLYSDSPTASYFWSLFSSKVEFILYFCSFIYFCIRRGQIYDMKKENDEI